MCPLYWFEYIYHFQLVGFKCSIVHSLYFYVDLFPLFSHFYNDQILFFSSSESEVLTQVPPENYRHSLQTTLSRATWLNLPLRFLFMLCSRSYIMLFPFEFCILASDHKILLNSVHRDRFWGQRTNKQGSCTVLGNLYYWVAMR